jgi:hypothetical protein
MKVNRVLTKVNTLLTNGRHSTDEDNQCKNEANKSLVKKIANYIK